MPGLPSALRLLACRGDHGLLGMSENTSVCVVCGLWLGGSSWGTALWNLEVQGSPDPTVSRKTDLNPCLSGLLEPFAESSMPSWAFYKVDGFCLLN